MPFSVNQVTVGTAATLILAPSNSDKAEITIVTKGKDVWLGGSDVTTATGLNLQAGATVTLKIGRNDSLYGVTDSMTHAISYYLYQPN
jgi:hypothetical protein